MPHRPPNPSPPHPDDHRSPAGVLTIDRAKADAEERLEGKYLLATSDSDISAEGGCKNLLEAERAIRGMRSELLLRPVEVRAFLTGPTLPTASDL